MLENIKHKTALITFDFRANGYSSGKYVTLGWFEALDLNSICNFLAQKFKIDRIDFWGRSMGGCAIILF